MKYLYPLNISFYFLAVFGMAATIIPRVYTYYISTALFAIFGLKMLKDGYYMSPTDAQEELEEVQSDLKKREDEVRFADLYYFFLSMMVMNFGSVQHLSLVLCGTNYNFVHNLKNITFLFLLSVIVIFL